MSQEKMRKEFEAWYSAKAKNNYMHLDKVDDDYIIRAGIDPARSGEYVHTPAQEQWAAWQASRADMVIELPGEASGWSPDECAEAEGFNDCLDRCVSAIEAAGLKVKQ